MDLDLGLLQVKSSVLVVLCEHRPDTPLADMPSYYPLDACRFPAELQHPSIRQGFENVETIRR